MNKLPVELYDIVIQSFSINDLKSFCLSNKKFMNYCKFDKKKLVKKYFKNPDDIKNISFLFNTKDELYEHIGKELLDYLDEDYPINQNVKSLEDFGKYASKNWEKYISTNPVIIILWYVHTLKSKPSIFTLKKFFKNVPKSILREILEYDVDWFNTDNIYAKNVFEFLKTN